MDHAETINAFAINTARSAMGAFYISPILNSLSEANPTLLHYKKPIRSKYNFIVMYIY